jgi:hypothetical protein
MTYVKSVARQANSVDLYKNCMSKLLKFCANIYFNKQCLLKKVIPKYAEVKFGNSSPAARVTTKKAQITRIKQPKVIVVLYNKLVCMILRFMN